MQGIRSFLCRASAQILFIHILAENPTYADQALHQALARSGDVEAQVALASLSAIHRTTVDDYLAIVHQLFLRLVA